MIKVYCKVYNAQQAIMFDEKWSSKPYRGFWADLFMGRKYIYAIIEEPGSVYKRLQGWMPPLEEGRDSVAWLTNNGFKEVHLFDVYLQQAEQL